jgi:RNA polymerase sigma factor (sigma-70 family)
MAARGSQASEIAPPERSSCADRERAEGLVLELIGSQADSLLRVARRYSLCPDDAHDAYQRGLEILIRHATRLDPERAAGWLHTVVKHEAMAINRSRRRMLGSDEIDVDALEARTTDSPEERVLATDRVARSAEALHGLKPQEVRALWLRALGHSYEQICQITGWTYTKVNRSLAEGRKSFLERYAGIESGRECQRLAPALSAFVDGEADAAQTVELRAHLRQCLSCRAAVRGLHDASRPLTVVLPATGLAVAAGGAEHTGTFFVRVYETVTLHLHERAANSFLRAQAIVDTVTAGKMAAVAASAAAVAGGGFAAEGAMRAGDRPPGAILLRDSQDLAAVPISRRQRPQPATQARAASTSKPKSKPKSKAHSKPHVRARRPASSPPAQQQAAPPTTATTSTSASRATVASAGTSAHAASSAAGEFGFEGP